MDHICSALNFFFLSFFDDFCLHQKKKKLFNLSPYGTNKSNPIQPSYSNIIWRKKNLFVCVCVIGLLISVSNMWWWFDSNRFFSSLISISIIHTHTHKHLIIWWHIASGLRFLPFFKKKFLCVCVCYMLDTNVSVFFRIFLE